MKHNMIAVTLSFLMFVVSAPAQAHFGMVIPSDNIVLQSESRHVDLTLSFSHPFERVGMTLEKPDKLLAAFNGRVLDIAEQLKPARVMDHPAWQVSYPLKKPGAVVFVMVPKPYWESTEDAFIIHYTKTVVAAFGDDTGWDTEIGLKTEIVPLTRPLGLYAGNTFQGIVKVDGLAVPFADVEVEYYNRDGQALAPNDLMITQTIKTDVNGVFSYTAPAAGWWGFAALTTAKEKKQVKGQPKDVELGAVIWVKFENWRQM